jgi:DNA-binding NtrC family response regulator
MQPLPQLLICDDDRVLHLATKHALKGRFECRSAYDTDEALAIVRKHPIDILLLDVQMRTPDEGLRAIPRLREADADLAIVMISAMTDFVTVREAMRLGAWDYVPKDFDPDDLHHTLGLVLRRRSLLQRNEQQNFEAVAGQRKHVLVGESAAMKQLRRIIERARPSAANVVITGETGTGKEVVARQLRATLPDGSLAPFVAVDSSTIQGTMAESVLFGHEKGAFTGAERTARGIFEEAHGGIAYFDEIANMPTEIQAKLLRVIQEKEVTRLGATRAMPLEFRVICATNRDLEQLSREGRFKDDLLQRLNVIPIRIPPLRERREDVPELARHFARLQPSPRGPLTFTDDAVQVLQAYAWPGNVRELANVVAYLSAMTDGPEIDVPDLPPKLRDAGRAQASPAPDSASFYAQVSDFERRILADAYDGCGGNISRLAIRLGMDRSHLYTKLREHGLHPRKGS